MTTLTREIPPDWDAIDGIREEVMAFLRERPEPAAVVDAIAMVVTELTENAMPPGTRWSRHQRLSPWAQK